MHDFAESKRNGMNLDDVEKFAIPLAESAALAEQEARWRFEWMMQRAAIAELLSECSALRRFATTARTFRRTRITDGAVRRSIPPWQRTMPLLAAADAYHSAGDEQNELRVSPRSFSHERARQCTAGAFLPVAPGEAAAGA